MIRKNTDVYLLDLQQHQHLLLPREHLDMQQIIPPFDPLQNHARYLVQASAKKNLGIIPHNLPFQYKTRFGQMKGGGVEAVHENAH
jgi:hypothetical protein